MTKRYKDQIKKYCESSGISIPIGFDRHSASRYVVFDMSTNPPKLIAKTWFNKCDVVHYLKNHSEGRKLKILDFKDNTELFYDGGKRLKRVNLM